MNLKVSWPASGRYILAVSGGIDSMTLLSVFADGAGARGYDLRVAHFDHGLRADSSADRKLVESAAKRLGLPFVHTSAALGRASEAEARHARYAWLRQLGSSQGARIVTAHHQDDLIETSLLNLARGTMRRGLAPMRARDIVRPLLGIPRADIEAYARQHQLKWNEDATNTDTANPRNFLRHVLLPVADAEWRASYLRLIGRVAMLDDSISAHLDMLIGPAKSGLAYTFQRSVLQELGLAEAAELIAACARRLDPAIELDSRLLEELALFAKTAVPHRFRPIDGRLGVLIERDIVTIGYKSR